MNISEILSKFFEKEYQQMMITDSNDKVLYLGDKVHFTADSVIEKFKSAEDDLNEWEFFDNKSSTYYRTERILVTYNNEKYICYHFTDVSEYTKLVKETIGYTKSVSEMSAFQTDIMKKLSKSYDAFLPVLAKYCTADEVVIYMQDRDHTVKSIYNGELIREKLTEADDTEQIFSMKRGYTYGMYGFVKYFV